MKKTLHIHQKKISSRWHLSSEHLCTKWKGTHIHKRNITKLKSHIELNIINSERLQQPTLTNRHIIERESKHMIKKTNWIYEPSVPNRYPNTKEHTFFSAPSRTVSTADHIPAHKASLIRYMKTEITPCILFNHHGLKLNFNNEKT